MIAAAHELNLLTSPYVFDEEQARSMVSAGADIVVAHMGFDDERHNRSPNGDESGRGCLSSSIDL